MLTFWCECGRLMALADSGVSPGEWRTSQPVRCPACERSIAAEAWVVQEASAGATADLQVFPFARAPGVSGGENDGKTPGEQMPYRLAERLALELAPETPGRTVMLAPAGAVLPQPAPPLTVSGTILRLRPGHEAWRYLFGWLGLGATRIEVEAQVRWPEGQRTIRVAASASWGVLGGPSRKLVERAERKAARRLARRLARELYGQALLRADAAALSRGALCGGALPIPYFSFLLAGFLFLVALVGAKARGNWRAYLPGGLGLALGIFWTIFFPHVLP